MPKLPSRITILGATGFIGKRLALKLSQQGLSLTALCRSAQKLDAHTRFTHIIEGDATNPDDVALAIRDTDAVVCCAGTVRGRDLDSFSPGNIEIPRILVDTIQRIQPHMPLVYLSSLAARNPAISDYANSKRQGESVIQACHLPNYVIIRPPAVYGPGDQELKPLFHWLSHGLLFAPKSNGARFSLLHVDDLCSFVYQMLMHWPTKSALFEIDDGHPDGYSWQDLADIASEVFQRRVTRIDLSPSLLYGFARLNMLFSRLFGRAPMLTTGKVNEFLEKNWVCARNVDNSLPWKPAISFREGLASLYNGSVNEH